MSAILLGSGVPAIMYLTWNAMVLGNVPEGSLGPHGLDLYSLLGAGKYNIYVCACYQYDLLSGRYGAWRCGI